MKDNNRAMRHAHTKNAVPQLTVEQKKEIKDVYDRAKGSDTVVCAICNKKVPRGKRHVDHILPFALGGLHIPENLQITCASCNMSKGGGRTLIASGESNNVAIGFRVSENLQVKLEAHLHSTGQTKPDFMRRLVCSAIGEPYIDSRDSNSVTVSTKISPRLNIVLSKHLAELGMSQSGFIRGLVAKELAIYQ